MRKLIVSIFTFLLLCTALISSDAAVVSFAQEADSVDMEMTSRANADNAILGEEVSLKRWNEDLSRNDSWIYELNLENLAMVYFDITTSESLDAKFHMTVVEKESGKPILDTENYVNDEKDYFDSISLNPGTYTLTFTNTSPYYMYYDFKLSYCRFYTEEDPLYCLDKDKLTIYTGKTAKLTAQVLPESAAFESVTWKSGNPDVATVNSNGLVTAKAKGTATITANIDGHICKCKITVKNPAYSLNANSASLYIKKTKQLKLSVNPSNYGLNGVKWKSSNPSVATVNSKGLVTAKTKGTATITASVNGVEKTCKITVKNPVYSALNYSAVTLYAKKTVTLKIKADPSSCGLDGLKWKSSNPKVAAVNSKGLVTAKAKGTATITASINGEKRTCKITVKPIQLNKSSVTVYVKKNQQLKVYGGTGNVSWKSNNKKVATVSSKGVVKGIKPGKATITATKNGKKMTCKVTVKWEPETGTVTTKNYTVKKGKYGNETKSFTLKGKSTVTLTAKNTSGTEGEYLYVTLDDSDGYIQYIHEFLDAGESAKKTVTLKPGKYGVYYDADDGCKITLSIKTKPQMEKSSVKIGKGYSKTLKVAGVKNGGKWSSSNKSIATVTSKGVVKAKRTGTCYIKYALKTGKVLKCKVKVVNPVTCSVSYVSDTGIYNECGVNFTNYTNKKITYIKLNIKQYDNKGSRLYDGPYDWYYVNDDLAANSSDAWEFWVSDNAKKCSAYITKVHFADGTTWKP